MGQPHNIASADVEIIMISRYLLVICFISWITLGNVVAYLPVIPIATHRGNSRSVFATIQSSNTHQIDEGAKKFESWFHTVTKDNDTLSKVRHCIFSNGVRGLEYLGSSLEEVVITLPKNRVLYSTCDESRARSSTKSSDSILRWDVSLALQLLQEYKKGNKSDFYGYCQLLTQGCDFEKGSCPPSTAPNALRNWTTEQKDLFEKECGPRGKQLLRMEENQKQEWMDQYRRLSTSLQSTFTLEQFAWAMEAVYSRSFKGDFVSNLSTQLISSLIVPLAATALGINYLITNPTESNAIALGLVGFLPLVLKNLGPKNSDSEAVLLPFIDSANHMEKADTHILYDPLKGVFTLTASGEYAFVDDEDCNKRKCTQLFISYGAKRDTELLINYGFLPGVDCSETFKEDLNLSYHLDTQRKALIQAFRRRNL